jgi:hypothetical protein
VTRRTIEVEGERWHVYPSGRSTQYDRDEFGLVFENGTGPDRVRRVTRFAPLGARRWDQALFDLSEQQLHDLFGQSQPAQTSPEIGYGRRAEHG